MKRRRVPYGLVYTQGFLKAEDYQNLLSWVGGLHPLWEERYSYSTRKLSRPVYWLGSWQFACLNYYHPPRGTLHRCVRAEPFPEVLKNQVIKIEEIIRTTFRSSDLPKQWKLNTCLVNYYGHRMEQGKKLDLARVGEHKDFEPGPVASLSIGERALFQFVESHRRGERDRVVFQQWLDNGSLMLFGGYLWKEKYFHRIQRVDRREKTRFSVPLDDFVTRRINLTLRYVPEEHVTAYEELPEKKREAVGGYIKELSKYSSFFEKLGI